MKKFLVVSILALSLIVSPCFAIEFCGDGCTFNEGGNFEVSFCLDDVPEPLITAAMILEFDHTALKGGEVTFDEVWDPGMSSGNPLAGNPGKYLVTAGNLSNANPDGNDNIGIATVIFSCQVGNCAGQQIRVSTVPSYDSVVGGSSRTVYDSQIEPKTFTIVQCTTTTTTIPTCDGSEDVCISIGDGSGPPGSTDNPVPVLIENLSNMNVRGYEFDVCDEGDYLTCTNAFEHSSGCARILSYSFSDYLIASRSTLDETLLYDITPNILPGLCIPLTLPVAKAADDSRPLQPLKVAVMPGKFCIECPSEQIYGANSEEIELLRSFRDKILKRTSEGQELIQLYYQWSPIIIKAMKEDEAFKAQVKEMIDEVLPMIEKVVE